MPTSVESVTCEPASEDVNLGNRDRVKPRLYNRPAPTDSPVGSDIAFITFQTLRSTTKHDMRQQS
jgi:hypothetical protein